jgi:hypothetical protein
MSVTVIKKATKEKLESPIKSKKSSHHTKESTKKCPTKKSKKEPKREITEMNFYSEDGQKIFEIDREGKVIFKIIGENLTGRKLELDFSDHNDIKFKYEDKEITDGDLFLVEMNGNIESINLLAEFIIK